MKTSVVVGILVILILFTGLCAGIVNEFFIPYFTPKTDTIIVSNTQIDHMSIINEKYPKPENFNLMLREINTHYVNMCDLGKNYYMQPDFYVDSWIVGKEYYETHDYGRWAVHGHGAFPATHKYLLTNPKTGDVISFCTLYRTGWAVETWQGIRLEAVENEYFEVVMTPNEFLLPPTFPVVSDGWVKKIDVKIYVKNSPPLGNYVIDVYSESPSLDSSRKWFWYVFEKDINVDHLDMIEECKENFSSEICQEWINLGRRNKYIEAGQFNIGSRMSIELEVK